MPKVALGRIDWDATPPVEEWSPQRNALAPLAIANVATTSSIGACVIVHVVLGCILMIIKVSGNGSSRLQTRKNTNMSQYGERYDVSISTSPKAMGTK